MNFRLPRPAWVLALLTAAAPLPTAVRADTQSFDLGGGVRLEVERIAKGQFTMGSPESETDRNPDEKAHPVTLSRDFYLGRTPVTVAQWQGFVTETGHRSEAENGVSGGYGWNGTALEQRAGFTWKNPGFAQSPDHPVVMVTWEDARQFMKWLGGKTGWTFDFPSEAQWEYACRAGTATAWWSGEEVTAAGPALWSRESSGNRTHPAAALPANPWRLHISGHVWEWCADWYGPYDGLPEMDPLQRNPPSSDKPRRVLRGGSWLRPLKDTRSAARYRNDPRSRNADNGFRVMSYGPAAQASAPAAGGSGPTPIEPLENGTAHTADTVDTVDPGDLQPDPAAENLHSGQSKTSSSGSAFWVRVLPWGIGALAVLWLLRRMARGSGNPLPARLPLSERRPPPPPPLNGPLNLAPGAFLARPVDDGFWLHAGYAAGTWLNLTWQDERGQPRERRVCYEPGDDGHFVYTGAPADHIQLRPEDGGASEGIPPLPLPLSSPPPSDPGSDPSWQQRGGGRGHLPSAY